jgi:hypothetical protein
MFSRLRLVMLCAIAVGAFSLFASTGSAAAAGEIKGEVVEAGSSLAVEGVEVCAFKLPTYELLACEETDVNGKYALSGLPNGEYIVEFWASYLGFAPQFFNGVSSYKEADEIIVNNGVESGIDAEMEEGGAIEGRVTDVSTGAGITGVFVCAYSPVIAGNCAITTAAGGYEVVGLATGSYAVEFSSESPAYPTLFYNQQSSPNSANSVTVTAPNVTGNINAQMGKPSAKVVVIPTPVPPTAPTKHKTKALKCHKGFKKTKRHGRQVCVKKHRKKRHHHS